MVVRRSLIVSLLLLGCPGDSQLSDETDGGSGSGSTSVSPTTVSADDDPATSSNDTADGSADGTGMADSGDTSASTADDTAGGSEETGTPPPPDPIDCGNNTYACGDGKDNDGDGLIDLMDPECTGPCDDDESSFQTGIPGDNVDCKQDCFFDGNSGQGDDGCNWDLTCDPENPGAGTSMPNCEYTGGMNCENRPPNQTKECIDFCMQFVPPGCDCFGCCIVVDDMGVEHQIFINSPDPECTIDNIEACNACTQSDDCVNDCVPEDCEICFGETEPPPGCDDNMCDMGDPCKANADCPTDYYCFNSCCYPPPPG